MIARDKAGTPELSKANLAALDLLIATMEERGLTSLGAPDAFITAIADAFRSVVTNVADEVTATEQLVLDQTENTPQVLEVTEAAAAAGGASADLSTSDNPVIRAAVSEDVTLERLLAVRRELDRG